MNQQFNLPPVQAAPTGAPPIEIKVAGVKKGDRKPLFPGYIHRLRELNEQAAAATGAEGIAGVVMREPDNAFDPNAIAIHCPALGMQVGYVPASDATWMAPIMDAGARYSVELLASIDPAHPNNPGIVAVLRAAA